MKEWRIRRRMAAKISINHESSPRRSKRIQASLSDQEDVQNGVIDSGRSVREAVPAGIIDSGKFWASQLLRQFFVSQKLSR
jgi:hypothetical protein